MSRHLGIGKRAVVHPVGLEVLVADECFQAVARRFRIDPAGNQQGASELPVPPLIDPLQFGVKEAAVKGRIMGDQMVLRDESCKSVHDFSDRGSTAYHLVGDAGILLDEAADSHAGIHQALETIHDPVVLDEYGPDLDRPVTMMRREAGGLKIEYDYAVIAHGFTISPGLSYQEFDGYFHFAAPQAAGESMATISSWIRPLLATIRSLKMS